MRLFIFAIIAALAITPAQAQEQQQPLSAADLQTMCSSASDIDYGFCAGYVSAIAHAMLTQNIGTARACNHENVRSQQLVDTYNSYTKLFPQQLSGAASDVAAAAMARAFPCISK
jgi:Rap1a immunity proteins